MKLIIGSIIVLLILAGCNDMQTLSSPKVTVENSPSQTKELHYPVSVILKVDRDSGYWATNTMNFNRFSAGTVAIYITNDTTLYYYGKDDYNTGPLNKIVFTFDYSPPKISFDFGPTNDLYTNRNFSIQMKVSREYGYVSMNGMAFELLSPSNTFFRWIGDDTMLRYYTSDGFNVSTTNEIRYTFYHRSISVTSGPKNTITTNKPFTITLTSSSNFSYYSLDNGSTFRFLPVGSTNIAVNSEMRMQLFSSNLIFNSGIEYIFYQWDTNGPSIGNFSDLYTRHTSTNLSVYIGDYSTIVSSSYKVNSGIYKTFYHSNPFPVLLDPGTNWIQLTATDSLGNSSPIKSNMIVLDTNRPVCSWGLTADVNVLNGTFIFTHDASDNYGLANHSFILRGMVSNAGSGIASWSVTKKLMIGDNTIFAYATDIAGNVSFSNKTIVHYTPRLLKNISPTAFENFGYSVAVADGESLIFVGAPQAYGGKGAVLVYEYDNTNNYKCISVITQTMAGLSDRSGTSIAISSTGDTLAIGAPGASANKGIVYIYHKPGISWSNFCNPKAVISFADAALGDGFGEAIALSPTGNTLVVGSPATALNQGAAYIYLRVSNWTTRNMWNTKLNPTLSASGILFGSAVSTTYDGETVVVSAKGHNNNRGIVYVYERNGVWSNTNTPTAALSDSDNTIGDNLGSSLVISRYGGLIVAGAPGVSLGKGAVYIYKKPGMQWLTTPVESKKLTDTMAAASDKIGSAVAVSGDGKTITVGAEGKGGTGGVYRVRTGDGWVTYEWLNVILPGMDAGDGFGGRVAMSGTSVSAAVSAYLDDNLACSDNGSVYLLK